MVVLFTVEEEDVFQCGKCKRKFSYLSQFLGHKQNQCVVAVQTSDAANSAAANASVQTAGVTNTSVIYTTQLPHAQSNKQITVTSSLFCSALYLQYLVEYLNFLILSSESV